MKARHMQTRKKNKPDSSHHSGGVNSCFEWMEAIVGSILIVVTVFTFFFGIKRVSGDSMLPTLYDQDRIVLTNLFYQPKPKDIVVVAHGAIYDEPLVKRVIAVEGQTVDINRTGDVFVDGVLQEEPYIQGVKTTRGEQEYPLTVPDGCIFVMGDNRMNSLDSRSLEVDVVDERLVVGKVRGVVFPFDRIQLFS